MFSSVSLPVDPPDGAFAPVFDHSVLHAFLGEDKRVIASVLQTFLSSMTESMLALHAALAQDDLLTVATLAHRTKGAAFMSGAFAMAQQAQRLEQMARCADLIASGAATVLLEDSWQALRSDPGLQSTLAGG
jgi:HPt (histidine-containing phosphotransfer) domain-containing protein